MLLPTGFWLELQDVLSQVPLGSRDLAFCFKLPLDSGGLLFLCVLSIPRGAQPLPSALHIFYNLSVYPSSIYLYPLRLPIFELHPQGLLRAAPYINRLVSSRSQLEEEKRPLQYSVQLNLFSCHKLLELGSSFISACFPPFPLVSSLTLFQSKHIMSTCRPQLT